MARHSVALVCGLAVVLCVLFVVHLARRMLGIPTREEREWADIEEALYGPPLRSTSGAAGVGALSLGAAREAAR